MSRLFNSLEEAALFCVITEHMQNMSPEELDSYPDTPEAREVLKHEAIDRALQRIIARVNNGHALT